MPEKMLEKKKIKKTRTSVIRKGIKRTLSTAQFETLVIEESMEETIEWNDLKERDQKLNNWDTVLLQRFKITHDRVLEELGLDHKKAYFKNPTAATVEKYKHVAEKNSGKLDLDDLDTLG